MITLVMLGIAASFALAHWWLPAELALLWAGIIEVLCSWYKRKTKKKT